MTEFSSDIERSGSSVPRSASGIALMVRRLGVMDSAYARLIWSRALAEAIEQLDVDKYQEDFLKSLDIESDDFSKHFQVQRLQDAAAMRSFHAYMKMRSRSATMLLLWLVAHPDTFHPSTELRQKLGFAESSIKVFICDIRKSFRSKGLIDPISSFYRKGYCVSSDCASVIKDLMSKISFARHASDDDLDRLLSPLKPQAEPHIGNATLT